MEEIQSVLKIIFSVYAIYKFGFILGIIIIYLVFLLYRIFMKKVFNLEMLLNLDKVFVGQTQRERLNIQILLIFDNFDQNKIKELVIDRAITQIKKLRQKVVYKFGNFFWQEVSLQSAINRIQIIEDQNIKNENDLLKYAESELNNQIDTLKDLPYEIKIISYENKGALLWKIDHVLSDGLGILSTVCLMADNYDIKLFPSIMQNYKFNMLQYLLDKLSFIYYGPLVAYQSLIKDNLPSPFRLNKSTSGKSRFIVSKPYRLDALKSIRKELNISFNNIVMCVLSKTYKQIKIKYGDKYCNTKYLNVFMPVGRKEVPKNIADLKLSNEAMSIFTKIPLIDDIRTEHRSITKSLDRSVKSSGYCNAGVTFGQLAVEFLPRSLQNIFGNLLTENIDIAVSNVPGPTCPLYFAGCKINKLFPIVSTQRLRAFLPILSYDNHFTIVMSVDVTSEIDNEEFLRILDQELKALMT